VDICNVGGFTEALKVAGWAEAHYIDLMPHNPLGPICTGMHDDELSLPCLLARSLARSLFSPPLLLIVACCSVISAAACVHLGAAVPNFAWMEDWRVTAAAASLSLSLSLSIELSLSLLLPLSLPRSPHKTNQLLL
jgi:L-alanine-DL-glutamate epimerase-like enolase superfamily enzyme